MNATKVIVALAMCLMLCILAGVFVEQVYAAKSVSQADSNLASKRGLEVLEGTKKEIPKTTKLQKTLGIGSIFVMIAVLKWL